MVLSTTGACQVVGNCIQSSGYPSSFGSAGYGHYEACTITGVPASPISVSAFSTESGVSVCYDYLTIDTVQYCGTNGPTNVVASNGLITWISDHSVTRSGWELC
eukprot:953990-Prymnesium_polylepis.2